MLDWNAGGFRLTGSALTLLAHRWLGICREASAGFALPISDASHRSDRRSTRMAFQPALLVVAELVSATGYFGCAAVFCLKHVAWPR
jgi:hypothetical protein